MGQYSPSASSGSLAMLVSVRGEAQYTAFSHCLHLFCLQFLSCLFPLTKGEALLRTPTSWELAGGHRYWEGRPQEQECGKAQIKVMGQSCCSHNFSAFHSFTNSSYMFSFSCPQFWRSNTLGSEDYRKDINSQTRTPFGALHTCTLSPLLLPAHRPMFCFQSFICKCWGFLALSSVARK